MRSPAAQRQSHANRDTELRVLKARRIEQLLASKGIGLESAVVLEIGTGSGSMAAYFARQAESLLSVDVVDERLDHSFPFRLVDSELLPAADCSFDLIISNHVIEHVWDPQLHLGEVARVMKANGVCYLATPNRLWPIEPHFQLPFLAWLPSQPMRNAYVRLSRAGRSYDASLVTIAGLARLAQKARLHLEDVGFELTRTVVRERLGLDVAWTRRAWPLVRWLAPSIVTLLRKT